MGWGGLSVRTLVVEERLPLSLSKKSQKIKNIQNTHEHPCIFGWKIQGKCTKHSVMARAKPPRSGLAPFSIKVDDSYLAPRIQPGRAEPNASTCYLWMTDVPKERKSLNAAFKKMADGSVALVALAYISPGPIYTGDRQTLSEELIAASLGRDL